MDIYGKLCLIYSVLAYFVIGYFFGEWNKSIAKKSDCPEWLEALLWPGATILLGRGIKYNPKKCPVLRAENNGHVLFLTFFWPLKVVFNIFEIIIFAAIYFVYLICKGCYLYCEQLFS